ncbi:hypothetical protein AeMF1_006055 [Aphanomyces euteiches]|nr:hypothetical protein AeMF1_006055 [Aphanomyces euteiches]
MQAFTGHVPVTPLNVVVMKNDEYMEQVDWTKQHVMEDMRNVQQSMETIHQEIVEVRERKRWRDEAAKTHGEEFVVHEGDYVLWSRINETRYPKLLVTWLGPFKVKEVGEYSCMIENILTNEVRQAHQSRLKLYGEIDFEITQEIREHVSEQEILLKIRRISDARLNPQVGRWEVLCFWEGLEDAEASWEKFETIAREACIMAERFIETLDDSQIKSGLLEELNAVKKHGTSA